jgi:hypothetical protein
MLFTLILNKETDHAPLRANSGALDHGDLHRM